MKPDTKKLLIIGIPLAVFLGIFLVFTISIYVFFFGITNRIQTQIQENRRKQNTETAGSVIRFSQEGVNKKPSLGYEFFVNGKSYLGTSATYASPEQRTKETKGKVCYEPSNPPNSEFYFDTNKICGQ